MRRLPPWMLSKTSSAPAAAPNAVSNVDNGGNVGVNDNVDTKKKKKSTLDQKRKSKKRVDTTDAGKEEDLASVADLSSLAKSIRKRQKNDILEEVSCDHKLVKNEQKCGKLGKRRNVKSKHLAKSIDSDGEEIQVPSPTHDDDGGLTVEDLVSIAEEYVKASDDSEKRQSSSRECESSTHVSITTASGAADHESRLQSGGSMASSDSHLSLTSEQNLSNVVRTGDPAQDMLELFLGPLLKKAVEDDKETESMGGDMLYSQELKAKNHNDVGEAMAPHIKKRSSLKDKSFSFL